MSKDQYQHGNLDDNKLTRAPTSSPISWRADALPGEGLQAEQRLHLDRTSGDALPKEGLGEALQSERVDKEHADEDNGYQGQDGDDNGDEDQESDPVSDQETASDTEDSDNESSRSESPLPCECGYVSHDSDWDSSSDDESEYDCFGHCSEDDGFSRSYRHFVTCRANKEPFPLEKLPPEVRRMIFRFAMPDDRFEPLHEPEYDWNNKYDGRMLGFGDCMEEETESQAIPYSLFNVQGFIANEALAVFHNEVFFRMDISLFGIRTRDHLADDVESFKNHKTLAQWTEFENRRKYHLNIKLKALLWAGDRDVYQDPCSYEHGSYRIKEWIRLVSDELLAKKIIQSLVVTAPCKCALKAAGLLPKDEASVVDLFTPLKRTYVPNPVILSLHNDRCKNGIASPCIKPACLQLSHNIQTMLGRLDGEPLSEQEAIWKDCKSRYCDDAEMEKKAPRLYDDLYTSIESVWVSLSMLHPWETTFEEAVQTFRKHIVEREQARGEKREQQRKEEQEKTPEKEHEKEQS